MPSNTAVTTGADIFALETSGLATSHRLVLLAYALDEHKPTDPVAWAGEVFDAYRAKKDAGYAKPMSDNSANAARSTFLAVARVKRARLIADTMVEMAKDGFVLPSSHVPAAFRYAGGDSKGENPQATNRQMAEGAILKAQRDSVPGTRNAGSTGGKGKGGAADNATVAATVPESLRHLAAVVSPADASTAPSDQDATLAAVEAARALLAITRESENKGLHKALTGFLKRHGAADFLPAIPGFQNTSDAPTEAPTDAPTEAPADNAEA